MKTYRGDRTIDGVKVTVDDRPLDPHYEVHAFTRLGFEWSYEGPEPRQLALAILYDHLGDAPRALALCEGFMRAVVARFDNEWVLTGEAVAQAAAGLPASNP
jgi:hypothetical protein